MHRGADVGASFSKRIVYGGIELSHTIELKNVSKYYAGEDSVSMGFSRVDLDLDIGEFVVITGESGSGKSTLLNVISGLDTYEEGEMFVCGEDTTAYGTDEYENYRKTYIGNIFQDFNLINSYTVYQNIEVVMLLSGKKKSECRDEINRLIELVGMTNQRNTKAAKLSGGQKQRVAIARALAKDAPIIVADEPTGNLDSASANAVMKTLARVSKDRLVVIVTHNYEQAEPYATRKLTMHDGKIIEDKRISRAEHGESDSPDQLYDDLRKAVTLPGEMRRSSEIRLGVRNTFNLPAKFILLLMVYLFVSTAVLGQYATTMNSIHESEMLGSNPYFANTNRNRIVVKRADESSFTENDFVAIRATENVNDIIKNDIALDKGICVTVGDNLIEGSVVSFDQIDQSKITFGHQPQNDYEIVIRADASVDAFVSFAANGDEYIGKPVRMEDLNHLQTYEFPETVTLAGVILDEDIDGSSEYAPYGYSTVYVSEAVSRDILTSMMADASNCELNFGGIRLFNDYSRAVYASSNVPDGKVYLFDDQVYYYKNEEAKGKDFGLKITNRFFESEGDYTVDKIITSSNCTKLVGISKDDFDSYFNCVFISRNDFNKLFDRDPYQISVYMINDQRSDETKLALNEMGFTTLVIKETLTDSTGELRGVLNFAAYARLALEFIVLFIIAYAVIRLIMRSRNSYYTTLRMLGASRANTANILRVELIVLMIIAYGADLIAALAINEGLLESIAGSKLDNVARVLNYLTPLDYGILGAVLLVMSLVIANGYSRHIFANSAMKSFREGASA